MLNIVKAGLRNSSAQKFTALFFFPAISFVIAAWVFGVRAVSIFRFPAMTASHPLAMILLALICLGITVFHRLLPDVLRKNTSGILLAALFFIGYLMLGSIFNAPHNDINNIFFAADHGSWQGRLVSDDLWAYGLRAIHPFSFIILRPIVAVASLVTDGDKFFAGQIVLSFAGAACVYIVWKILTESKFDGYYAIGFASLMGLSASHLLFSSIFESYIFSACFLMLFMLFTLKPSQPTWMLVAAGVLTFGMTVSNFVQNLIVLCFARKNLRIFNIFFVIVSVLIIAIFVNFFNNQIYGSDTYFFSSENVSVESKNIQLPTRDHLVLLAQNMFFFNMVAPQPHFHGHGSRLRFNFATDGFYYYGIPGSATLAGWIILLGLAIWKFIRAFDLSNQSTRLSLAMAICLVFNYLLHILYGVEPFLYTADWTYALILFVAFNANHFAQKTWFKISFLALLGLVLITNGWFMYFMISFLKKNFGAAF